MFDKFNHAGDRAKTRFCSRHRKRFPSTGKHLPLRSPATVWQEKVMNETAVVPTWLFDCKPRSE